MHFDQDRSAQHPASDDPRPPLPRRRIPDPRPPADDLPTASAPNPGREGLSPPAPKPSRSGLSADGSALSPWPEGLFPFGPKAFPAVPGDASPPASDVWRDGPFPFGAKPPRSGPDAGRGAGARPGGADRPTG
ncbi:hypothetical protein ACUALU_27895, partial [Nocardiopsis changdeensis]